MHLAKCNESKCNESKCNESKCNKSNCNESKCNKSRCFFLQKHFLTTGLQQGRSVAQAKATSLVAFGLMQQDSLLFSTESFSSNISPAAAAESRCFFLQKHSSRPNARHYVSFSKKNKKNFNVYVI